MKEKDPVGNQPELTGIINSSKLGEEGEIFMSDEKGSGEEASKPVNPQEIRMSAEGTVQHLARITARADLDRQLPVTEDMPVDVRRAREDLIQERAAAQDLSRREASYRALIGRTGIEGAQIPMADLNAERIEEVQKLIQNQAGGKDLTQSQQDALLVLQELENQLPKQSVQGYLISIKRMLNMSPEEADRESQRLIKSIRSAPQRLERKAAKKTTGSATPEQPAIPVGIKLGAAMWKSKENDQPVKVTGYLGKGPDGRSYVSVEGSTTGVPLDEIKFASTEPEASGAKGVNEPPASSHTETEQQNDAQIPEEEKKRDLDPDDGQKIFDSVKRVSESIIAGLSEEEANILEAFRSIASAQRLPKDIIDEQIANSIMRMRGREKAESSEGYHLPESLEDLATLIMNSESDAWRTGGKKELIRDGTVVKEHFLAWIRKRAGEIDAFNPTTNINLFSDINVKFGYSQISLMEMVLTGSYFLKREKQEDGTYKTKKDSDYEKLKLEIIREAFLYNNDKNKWVTYKAKMGVEAELPELMIGLYYADPNFREDYLQQIVTLASTNEEKIRAIKDEAGENFVGHEAERVLEGNMDLGEGIRRAFLTYFHLADFEMLDKMAKKNGGNSFLFSEEYMDVGDNGEIVMVDGKPNMKSGEANDEIVEVKDRIRYENGKVIDDAENRLNFIKYMNIFNDANKDTRIVAEVRERIRQSLMDPNGLGLDYEEASFAERWAFNKTLPMGVGARCDTGASAFDATSRGINTLPYRLKQYMKNRKGQIGNIFDFGLVKRTGLTPLEEITDVHGKTVIEALQGGQGSDYDPHSPFDKKRDDYKKMMFGQDEGQRWSSMTFLNGEVVRKVIMEGKGFDIDKIVSYDKQGRPVIDQQKADEFLDKVQKAMRYKWCTWRGTNYSKKVRVMDWKRVDEKNEDGTLKIDRNGEHAFRYDKEWGDVPILSAYFGSEIIGFVKNDIERVKQRTGVKKNDPEALKKFRLGKKANIWEIEGIGGDNKIDISEVQNTQIRDYLWKHIEKAFIAKTLESHRNVFSELPRYGYSVVEKFYDFFRIKGIWDKEDEEEVRKLSKTSEGRVLGGEISGDLFLGLLAGAWKEIRKVPAVVVAK